MLITNDELAARRLARQVGEYTDFRSQQDYRRILTLDMADMAVVLKASRAVSDNVTVAKIERDIIEHAKKLNEPVPADFKWPASYTPNEFFVFDVESAISTAREFNATDDDLALGLANAVRGDVDEPAEGSLAEALYLWALRRAAKANLAAEAAKSQRNQDRKHGHGKMG